MTASIDWVKLAQTSAKEEFAAGHRHPFLVSSDSLSPPGLPHPTPAMGVPVRAAFDDGATVHAADAPPRSASSSKLLVLPVLKTQALLPSMITIGRTSNHDIVVPDVEVSKFHAFLRAVEGSWELFDAGSHNGTFVAERRLEPKGAGVVLQPGDTITLGRVSFLFVDAAGAWTLVRRLARSHAPSVEHP